MFVLHASSTTASSFEVSFHPSSNSSVRTRSHPRSQWLFIGAIVRQSPFQIPQTKQGAYLGESDIRRLFSEALTADVQAVFPDETCLVCADAAGAPLAHV